VLSHGTPVRLAAGLATADAGDGTVFLLYEYELQTGDRYRNAELITVRAARVIEIEVFFGGRVVS